VLHSQPVHLARELIAELFEQVLSQQLLLKRGLLLESLDTEVDGDAEVAWASELNRRVAELDSVPVQTIPWAEVRRRLAAR